MGVTGGTPVGFNVGVAAGDAGSTLPGIDLVCMQGKALTSTQRRACSTGVVQLHVLVAAF